MSRVVLPEYGRNIQQMAQYILTIEDRDRRNEAAHEIIAVMGNMSQQSKDSRDFKQKLWDHLALMTGYQLDVDYPYEINKKSAMQKSDTLSYNVSYIPLRHYGRIVQQMVRKAIEIEDENQKNELILIIANQMKKLYVQWNNNTVNDEVIFQDLKKLSGNKLTIKEDMRLNHVKVFTQNNNQKQKSNNKGKLRNKKK